MHTVSYEEERCFSLSLLTSLLRGGGERKDVRKDSRQEPSVARLVRRSSSILIYFTKCLIFVVTFEGREWNPQ